MLKIRWNIHNVWELMKIALDVPMGGRIITLLLPDLDIFIILNYRYSYHLASFLHIGMQLDA